MTDGEVPGRAEILLILLAEFDDRVTGREVAPYSLVTGTSGE